MNHYFTSDGERVSQATIDRRVSEAYKQIYAGEGYQYCHGCGGAAQGTAHIVPKAVCKVEGITEYCWLRINMFPSCHICNQRSENFRAPEFLLLKNVVHIVEITKKLCLSRYLKMEAAGVTIDSVKRIKNYEKI